MHQSFFVISGENENLAKDELSSIAKSYDKKAVTLIDSRLVIIKSKILHSRIAERATFVKLSGTLIEITTDFTKINIPNVKTESFACKAINLSSKKINTGSLERDMGSILKQKWSSKVSLTNPHITVYFIITDSRKYFGFTKRKTEVKRSLKLHKYPHELDPKLARCMVNLSQLKKGQTLCDPFCGTGTILLEAQSMGINTIGMDFDPEMCGITKKNLLLNGYDCQIMNSDYYDIKKIINTFDAIVTDLPYGISSKSSKEPERLAKEFVSIVPKKKKLVMVYKKGFDIAIEGEKYEIYRHKSLTRVIVVR